MQLATHIRPLALLIVVLPWIGACDNKPAATSNPSAASSAAGVEVPASLFVESPPAEALYVREAKRDAAAGKALIVRGRIGGRKEPFVEGRAVFTLVDLRLKTCADNADDACPTPWDYCCEPQKVLADHAMTVQIVDAGGQPLKTGIRGAGGLTPMADIVVTGKLAGQSGPGHIVLNAERIYVASAN
jgi:hypothetical protein